MTMKHAKLVQDIGFILKRKHLPVIDSRHAFESACAEFFNKKD